MQLRSVCLCITTDNHATESQRVTWDGLMWVPSCCHGHGRSVGSAVCLLWVSSLVLWPPNITSKHTTLSKQSPLLWEKCHSTNLHYSMLWVFMKLNKYFQSLCAHGWSCSVTPSIVFFILSIGIHVEFQYVEYLNGIYIIGPFHSRAVWSSHRIKL
jgi:hypothetical protein